MSNLSEFNSLVTNSRNNLDLHDPENEAFLRDLISKQMTELVSGQTSSQSQKVALFLNYTKLRLHELGLDDVKIDVVEKPGGSLAAYNPGKNTISIFVNDSDLNTNDECIARCGNSQDAFHNLFYLESGIINTVNHELTHVVQEKQGSLLDTQRIIVDNPELYAKYHDSFSIETQANFFGLATIDGEIRKYLSQDLLNNAFGISPEEADQLNNISYNAVDPSGLKQQALLTQIKNAEPDLLMQILKVNLEKNNIDMKQSIEEFMQNEDFENNIQNLINKIQEISPNLPKSEYSGQELFAKYPLLEAVLNDNKQPLSAEEIKSILTQKLEDSNINQFSKDSLATTITGLEINEKATEQSEPQPSPSQQAVSEQPTIEEPIVEQPVTEEPAVEQPSIEEPVVEQPVAEEPVVEQPSIEEPVVEQPTIKEPVYSGQQCVVSAESNEDFLKEIEAAQNELQKTQPTTLTSPANTVPTEVIQQLSPEELQENNIENAMIKHQQF